MAACGDAPAPAQGGQGAAPGEVRLTADVIQRLGVRTAVAEIGALSTDTSAVGVVGYDASTIRDVFTPLDAWVEILNVHAIGQPMRAGDLLLELYSPSLAIVDEQFLRAQAGEIAQPNNPYANGLRAIGLTEDMIDALRAKKRLPGKVPFRAANDGVVAELGVRQGAVVKQGQRLLQLTAVDPVWVNLAIPESVAAGVSAGAEVSLATPAYPGRSFAGRVDLVYPQLDAATRTLGARLVVPNPDGALKVNMFVSAVLRGPAAEPAVQVPAEAIIRGERDRVIVALGDGRFAARAVTVGRSDGNRTAIVSGLAAGESVVTSGVFLIDSETNLEAGLRRMETGDAAAPHTQDGPAAHSHQH